MDAETYAHIAWGLMATPGDYLATGLIESVGIKEALSLVVSKDSPARILQSLAVSELPRGATAQVERWRAGHRIEEVEHSHKLQSHAGIGVLGPEHPRWPGLLGDLGPLAPFGLWFRGDLEVLSTGRALAVVGSRAPSGAGLAHTTAIVAGPWCKGVTIVSGGATGIDTAAHQSALTYRRPTVAVLAGGLESVYPPANTALMSVISEVGAVISEAPCGLVMKPERFLARNRLIAALSNALVVVEATYRSGAMNSASHAAALGREIAVVPGRWEDPRSQGCFRIARERGAMILTEPADVGLLLPGVSHLKS
jgi:DNA processing protein